MPLWPVDIALEALRRGVGLEVADRVGDRRFEVLARRRVGDARESLAQLCHRCAPSGAPGARAKSRIALVYHALRAHRADLPRRRTALGGARLATIDISN